MTSEKEDPKVIEQFEQVKTRQYMVSAPVILGVIVLILLSENPGFTIFGLSSGVLLVSSMVVVLVGIVFSIKNWRCPACNVYLGKNFSPKFCPKCGIRLQR